MRKTGILLLFLSFCCGAASAQKKMNVLLYLGAGFAGEHSNVLEVGQLPLNEGGINFHYALHIQYNLGKRFGLETGVDHIVTGYQYDNGLAYPVDYTKITSVSVPLLANIHLINYPEEVPIRVTVAIGAYGAYAVSGRISHDDGTSQKAGFSDAKRLQVGPRWILRTEFVHRAFAYIGNEGSTNIIKNGNASVRLGNLQVGLGFVF